jgi:hypothetical protein
MAASQKVSARLPRRRVLLTAGYVLIVQSVFASLSAFVVLAYADAGFRDVPGGLRGALAEPGAALVVEGLLPFFFENAPRWGAALVVLFALHAVIAPLVQLAWLAGLSADASQSALRVGLSTYLAALRLRALLLVPTGLAGVLVAILVTYASLVLRGASERTHDLALVAALLLGAALFTPLRVLADLGHAALVRASLHGDAPSARQAVHTGLVALTLGAYGRWGSSLLLGLCALGLGALAADGQVDWLALLATQLAAYVRYASRGAWLASALASVSSGRRFGSSTRNSAPPLPSSALPAEMTPP